VFNLKLKKVDNKYNNKLRLNKKVIAQLNTKEMNKVLGGEDPHCWKSHVLCGNTGLRTTCKSATCTGQDICIICLGTE